MRWLLVLCLTMTPVCQGAYVWNATTTMATKTSPSGIDSDTVTFVAWIYPKSAGEGGDYGRIFMRGNSSGEITKQLLLTASNKLAGEVWKSTTLANADAVETYSLNAWTLVAFSYTPSDGGPRHYMGTVSTPVAETTYSSRSDGSGTLRSETGQRLDIGCRGYDGGRTFDGYIQEVRYYNTVLTVAQLNQIRAGFEPDRAHLIGYWPLNDAALSGIDMIGSNTLTVSNATWTDSYYAPIVRPWAWWASFLMIPWRLFLQ